MKVSISEDLAKELISLFKDHLEGGRDYDKAILNDFINFCKRVEKESKKKVRLIKEELANL